MHRVHTSEQKSKHKQLQQQKCSTVNNDSFFQLNFFFIFTTKETRSTQYTAAMTMCISYHKIILICGDAFCATIVVWFLYKYTYANAKGKNQINKQRLLAIFLLLLIHSHAIKLDAPDF